jgi:peptide/nickel transport system ATP-binding protein
MIRKNQQRTIIGKEISMIFQEPMTSLNPCFTAGYQIMETLKIHEGGSKTVRRARALELLELVGISDPVARLKAFPHQLSGGMSQRIMIAMAIACNPRLLIADEPTTALDVTVQHQILNLLAEQQRDRAMAMILVTHDLGVVAGRTDEIMVMYAGKVAEKAPTPKLFSEMRHPYTQGLLWSIPKVTQAKHTRLNAIPGRPPNLIDPPPGCKFAPRCAYAQDICRAEDPELRSIDSADHLFACHFPVGTPEGEEAFERNIAAEYPPALAAAGKLRASEEVMG